MTKKLTLEFVKYSFAKEGYVLLSNVYVNARVKLDYMCPKGHTHSITWDKWQQGKRCAYCSNNAKLDLNTVKQAFILEGYSLLSSEYKNAHTHLKYICSFGHKHSMSWYHWNSGRRCPTCKRIKMCGIGNPSWKGGISFEPYCEAWKDKEYKQGIINRDSSRCLNPYCDSPNKNDLTIHHIDYNKKNCHRSNLITVCRSCNSKANKDRKWHTAWYQAIIKNRYKY